MNKDLMLGVAASALTASLAPVAFASDLPSKSAPAVAPKAAALSWTGFSIGIGGGAQFMHAQTDAYNNIYSNNYDNVSNDGSVYSSSSTDLGALSAFGTVQIGADYQAGGMVFGAFADYNFGSAKADHSNEASVYSWDNTDVYNNSYGTHSVSATVGNSWDVGARLGFLINETNLIYALGGYSSADITVETALDAHWENCCNSNGDNSVYQFGSKASGFKSGWIVGAGWETAISQNVSLKTEYRHADYGTISAASDNNWNSVNNDDYGTTSGVDSKVTVDSVRAILNYKF